MGTKRLLQGEAWKVQLPRMVERLYECTNMQCPDGYTGAVR